MLLLPIYTSFQDAEADSGASMMADLYSTYHYHTPADQKFFYTME